jgi:hypothetical protein
MTWDTSKPFLNKAGRIAWYVSWFAIAAYHLNIYSGDLVLVILVVVVSAFPALFPAVLAHVIFPDKE